MISIMWWFHNRLFAKFFLLNAVSIVANFAMLGALMLMIYFSQAFSSLATFDPNAPRWLVIGDARYWFVSSAVVYGLLGLMYTLGLVARWPKIAADDRRFGLHRATASWIGCAMLIALGTSLDAQSHAKNILYIAASLSIAIALSRVVIKRLLPDPTTAA